MATFEVTTDLDDGRGDGLALVLSRRYPPWPDSVHQVRSAVAGCLGGETAACREAVVLIASELAANAVVHAGTPYVVELRLGDTVRIEVTDSGSAAPFVRLAPPDAESGRGLFIVATLAARCGVDWGDEYKVVWAEVTLDA